MIGPWNPITIGNLWSITSGARHFRNIHPSAIQGSSQKPAICLLRAAIERFRANPWMSSLG